MKKSGKNRKKFKIIIPLTLMLFFLALLTFTPVIEADSPSAYWNWKAFESDNFVLFFPAGYENQARETLFQLETHRPWITEFTGNEMTEKIHLSLEDIGLLANGYANPVFGKMGIFTGKPDSYSSLANYQSWLRLVSIHELIHMGHMTNAAGISSTTSRIFGDIMAPNIHSPLWLIEGLAVYGESQISPFEGRLNAGYYDGVLAARSRADDLPSLPEITYRHNHFPGGQQYLYGAAFIHYLAERYGQEKLTELLNTYGTYYWAPFIGNLFPAIGLDRAARQVYDQDISGLFQDWQASESKKYRAWQLQGKKTLEIKRGTIDRPAVNPDAGAENAGQIYFFSSRNYSSYPFAYHRKNQLISFDTESGEKKVLTEAIGRNFGSLQVTAESIYYLLGETDIGYPNFNSAGTGVSGKLFRYDLKSGESQFLLATDMTDFAVRYIHPDSTGSADSTRQNQNLPEDTAENREIIFTRASSNGYGSEIYSYINGEKQKIGILPEYISEIQSYQDDLLVVSKPAGGSWNIKRLKINLPDYALAAEQLHAREGKYTQESNYLILEPLIATPWPEKRLSLRIAENETDSIYYTANYQGYEAIYRYDFATGKITRMTADSYAESAVAVKDKLYYTTYSSEGMALYQTAEAGECFNPGNPENYADNQQVIPETGQKLTGSGLKSEKTEADRADRADNQASNFTVREIQSFRHNLSYLFPPAVRLPPFVLMGQDGLAANSYLIHLNRQGGLNIQLSSRLFQPVNLSLQTGQGPGTNRTALQLSYPLYRSRLDGLTGLWLDLETDFRSVRLGGQLNFRYPDHRLALYLEGRPVNQDFRARLRYHYLQEEGRLTLRAGLFNGLKAPQDIREFSQEGRQGYKLALSWTRRLAEIRRGSWNPNLFAGDLYGKLFFDFLNLEEKRHSLGAELLLEVGAASWLQFVPRLGAAFSRNDRKVYLGLELAL